MQSKQICDKEDAAAAFEAKQGLPHLACKAACVAKAHLDMARYLAPILAMAKTTGPGHDGAGSMLRASGSAISDQGNETILHSLNVYVHNRYKSLR
jgi:hypothetical protein